MRREALSKKRFRLSRGCSIACAVCSGIVLTGVGIPASADNDPSTIIVPYSPEANRTLGDSVNISFPYNPIGRCVDYTSTDVVWDTGGAISSSGEVMIVTSDDEESRTTNVNLGFQTESKIKLGSFGANSKFDTSFTTDTFRSDTAKTISIEFKARADYGRRLIQKYKLLDDAPSPQQDADDFLRICGTHFIRGEHRVSELTVIIRIHASSQRGKESLEAKLKKTMGGGFSLKAISGEAGATFTGSYKSIIEYAKKAGNISIEFRAHGGPGISTAGAIAAIDPVDLDGLSTAIQSAASQFSQDNSGIVGYVLQPNTALGASSTEIDLNRVEQIGELTTKLMALNDAHNRYQKLKEQKPEIFERFFRIYSDRLNVARSQIVQLINDCAAGNGCKAPTEDILSELHFLEDMFTNADVSLSCTYQRASLLHPVLNVPSSDPLVLETMSINLAGTSRTYDIVDFTAVNIDRLWPDYELSDESEKFSGFSFSEASGNGGDRQVFGTIYSENINPEVAVSYDASSRRYEIDEAMLLVRREKILGSMFSLSAPGPNGIKTSYDVGFPPREGCPTVKDE